jgi:hypothetical protein
MREHTISAADPPVPSSLHLDPCPYPCPEPTPTPKAGLSVRDGPRVTLVEGTDSIKLVARDSVRASWSDVA